MQLYLVQHGAAKSEAEDPQRGLTDEGRKTVEQTAEFLEPLNLSIQSIEHSEKLRARQTAEILAARLHPAHGTKQVAGIAPNDDIEPMCVRLAQEPGALMVVGHLPYLSRLASRLLEMSPDHPAVQFQMGGVVRLDCDEKGQWLIRWVLPPEVAVRD